jgi:hypothetical protein
MDVKQGSFRSLHRIRWPVPGKEILLVSAISPKSVEVNIV